MGRKAPKYVISGCLGAGEMLLVEIIETVGENEVELFCTSPPKSLNTSIEVYNMFYLW